MDGWEGKKRGFQEEDFALWERGEALSPSPMGNIHSRPNPAKGPNPRKQCAKEAKKASEVLLNGLLVGERIAFSKSGHLRDLGRRHKFEHCWLGLSENYNFHLK